MRSRQISLLLNVHVQKLNLRQAREDLGTAARSPVFWLCLMVYLLFFAEAVAFTRLGAYLIVNLILTATFIAGFAGTIRSIARFSGPSTFHLPWKGWILVWLLPAIILTPFVLVALDRVFKRFGYDLQIGPFLLYVGLTSLAGAYIVWFVRRGAADGEEALWRQPSVVLAVTLALAITAQWVAINSFPLHPGRSDMLPSIQVAVRHWLDGGGLYGTLDLGSHTIPTPYLPLMEIAYAPLVWMGIDLRWLGVVGLVVLTSLAYGVSRQRGIGLATVIATFVLSPLLVERHEVCLAPVWMLLALFGGAVVHRRWWLASLILGLCLATRKTSVLLLPLYAVLLWRQKGIGSVFLHLSLAVLVGGLILLPFVISAPSDFLYGVWGRYQESRQAPISLDSLATQITPGGFSVATVIYPLIGSTWGLILQVIAYLVIVLAGSLSIRRPADGLIWAAAAQTVFLLFNKPPWNWIYLYVSALILLLFAAIAKDWEQATRRATTLPKAGIAFRICAVLALGVTGAGLFGPQEASAAAQMLCQPLRLDAIASSLGQPSLVLECSPGFASERDRIYIYTQEPLDQIANQRWAELTNHPSVWLFDSGARGRPSLIIHFFTEGESIIADIYDDRNGDAEIGFQLVENLPRVTESPYWTVRVKAEEGWWVRPGKTNFNVDLWVDGPIEAAFGATIYLDKLENDGQIDFEISVRDPDNDGKPDFEIIQSTSPIPESWGIYRTLIMANPEDSEAPITGSVIWPYLGEGNNIVKGYLASLPPIQVSWSDGQVARIGEFVASRSNDGNWFVYSIQRLGDDPEVEANFESPFAFYDLARDQDGYPELQIRYSHFAPNDIYFESAWPYPWTGVRYSWDQDNNRSWDYKVDLLGSRQVAQASQIGGLVFRMVPPSELPDWVINHPWPVVTFVASEQSGYWTSEGIYEWPANAVTSYYIGDIVEEPEEAFASISRGFRGEYNLNLDSKPYLYFSPIDRKLHLLKAYGGIWNVNDLSKVHYADLDGDAYLDQWRYMEDGQVHYQLNLAAGYLVYAEEGLVLLKQADVTPSLFDTLPPRNHEEWLALGQQLERHQREFGPGDFEAMVTQFEGSEWRVEGARIRDFRPDDEGFRFVIELSSGFQVSGSGGPDLTNLSSGAYVVTYRRDFDVRPLTPASPEIVSNTFSLSRPAPVALEPLWIEAAFHNAGLEDVPSLWVQAYAEGPGAPSQLVAETEIALLADHATPVRLPWTPPLPGVWRISLVWGGDKDTLPASALGATALPVDVDAPQAIGIETIWHLSNVGQPAVLALLLASLGLAAAVLAVLYMRVAGGRP